jgi:hypothetical protein
MWTPPEKKLFRSLSSIHKIQDHIDALKYNPTNHASSPRWVMITNEGHCLEGALLAAAILEYHGHKPLLVDLMAHNDDHHVLAVYRSKSGWGSISKSNTTMLGGRAPVFMSIRELVMSYFEFYFNVKGERSLYAYSPPINLNRFNSWNWRTTDDDLDEMGQSFCDLAHQQILSIPQLKKLPRVSKKINEACFLGADPSGLYKA